MAPVASKSQSNPNRLILLGPRANDGGAGGIASSSRPAWLGRRSGSEILEEYEMLEEYDETRIIICGGEGEERTNA